VDEKCITEVTLGKDVRDTKTITTWKEMLKKQDAKIESEREHVAVKKRKGDFIFMTADTSNMDLEMKVWYMEENTAILQ
jgi:hypothetical protein